jgi:pyruvate-formate lyase-activating enzyme
MARFISNLPGEIKPVNFLPYHNIASGKYKKLEVEYNEGKMKEPSEKDITRAHQIFSSFGIQTEMGG